ncbi:hypothetical protein AK830_g6501 [Neonectria ditissima]|uniref:Major facilitator superfamily (MFS) profile domain-containing protein n=1 Tax=Neonectria ditissima TaxID=78410 RepID=A0A0N8H6W1_9HYPO|nr:hypothetical protein AK830_g6501 [Neonectria ditissima]
MAAKLSVRVGRRTDTSSCIATELLPEWVVAGVVAGVAAGGVAADGFAEVVAVVAGVAAGEVVAEAVVEVAVEAVGEVAADVDAAAAAVEAAAEVVAEAVVGVAAEAVAAVVADEAVADEGDIVVADVCAADAAGFAAEDVAVVAAGAEAVGSAGPVDYECIGNVAEHSVGSVLGGLAPAVVFDVAGGSDAVGTAAGFDGLAEIAETAEHVADVELADYGCTGLVDRLVTADAKARLRAIRRRKQAAHEAIRLQVDGRLPFYTCLTGPVLADMYHAKDRGKSLAIAGLLPYIGPALGPIVGGLAAQHLWWPWLFWILSIFDAAFSVLGFFVIRESYTPVLLQRKAKKIAACNNSVGSSRVSVRSRARLFIREFFSQFGPAISRPVNLLIHRPIIQLLSIAMAIQFGIYTLVLSTFASLWITKYRQSETSASIHYIAIALGAFLCAQGGGRLMDYMWRRTTAACPDREPTPEYRIPYIITGLVPTGAGLLWYAWAAENSVHWAVVDFGVFFFTCGSFMFAQGMMAYLVDEFSSTRAASASAATRLWTYILGFAFPIFAPALYEKLGYGWGNSLLALLFIALGAPITLVIWLWGDRIRAIGRTAEDEKERIL